jgi:hypothetical protein
MAWLETTQPTEVWDSDIYADMFRTIREINQKLPKAKQLRVLLGDTPYPSRSRQGADAALGHFSCGTDPARSDREEAQGADRLWRNAFSAQAGGVPPPMPGQPVRPPGRLSACLRRLA